MGKGTPRAFGSKHTDVVDSSFSTPMDKSNTDFADVVRRTIYKVVEDSALSWSHGMEADANNRILLAHNQSLEAARWTGAVYTKEEMQEAVKVARIEGVKMCHNALFHDAKSVNNVITLDTGQTAMRYNDLRAELQALPNREGE